MKTNKRELDASVTDDLKGISIAGRTGEFTILMFRDPKTGEKGEKILGNCRNVKAHPIYTEVEKTFKLFDTMLKFN